MYIPLRILFLVYLPLCKLVYLIFYPKLLLLFLEKGVWVIANICKSLTEKCFWTIFLGCAFYVILLYTIRNFNPKLATTLNSFTESLIVSSIELLLSMFAIFGGKSTQKLLFIPNADQQSLERWDYFNSNESNGFYEISQDAISLYLWNKDTADLIDKINSDATSKTFDSEMYQMLLHLKALKKKSQIIELEFYQSSMHWLSGLLGIYHTFIVLKTTGEKDGDYYWWSLEKNTKNIVMQKSRNKFAVVNRLMREDRNNVKIISENAIKGKGTIADLLTTLWAHNVITEKYHVVKSSCQTLVQFIEKANNQSFVNFVKKRITSFEPVVPYSNPPNKKLEPFISLLTKFPEWKPLFAIIYLGDSVLLENLLCNSKKYSEHTDVNLVDYGTTLLQLAIIFSKTKMVEILLRNTHLNLTPPENEISEMPWTNMSVFHTAAAFTNDTKIIDLLLKSEKVKIDPDAKKRTALHIAAKKSNETTVGHLLKIKPELNIPDNSGLSPLHLAAHHTDNTKVIDIILNAKKVNPRDLGIDDCDTNGRTALHHAVLGSNLTTARHLMKKGANPNHSDNMRRTPLELAAQRAKNIEIIELLLNNEVVLKELEVKGGDKVFDCAKKNETVGLSNEIENRLRNKNIIRKQEIPPKDDELLSSTGSLPDAVNKKKEKKKKKEKRMLEENKNMTSSSYFERCLIL